MNNEVKVADLLIDLRAAASIGRPIMVDEINDLEATLSRQDAQLGGRVIGSRNIDGVHVIVVSSFSGLADEQLFVRHDDYLAAQRAQPEQQDAVYAAHPSGDGSIIRINDGARLSVDEILAALAARQPVGQASPELFAAARDFYNETVGDPNVRISCESPEQRDVVTAAGERLRAALVSPPAQVDLRQWTKSKPTQPGIYAVRRFHYGHPDDYAVVEVVERDGELRSSLHQRTSEWPLADRYDARIADMSDSFEWLKVAPPIDQQAGKGVSNG